MAKLRKKVRKNIIQTTKAALGITGKLGDKQKKQAIQAFKAGKQRAKKRARKKGLDITKAEIKTAGAKNLLKKLNVKRGRQGLSKIKIKKKYGDTFGAKAIKKSRSFGEKQAYWSAKNTKLPKFDEEGTKKRIADESQSWWDQQLDDLKQQYGYYDEDAERQKERLAERLGIDKTQLEENVATGEGNISRSETRGLDSFSRTADLYKTQAERTQLDLAAARKSLGYQESDERRAQNVNFASRGVSSLSPTAQKLAERLKERQETRSSETERGYSQTAEDITKQQGYLATDKSNFQTDIAEQRRLLAQDQQRGTQSIGLQEKYGNEDYERSTDRIQEELERQRRLLEEQRKEKDATRLEQERYKALNY